MISGVMSSRPVWRTWANPASFNSSIFSSLRVTVIDVAPTDWAICIAAKPTLLEAAKSTTKSALPRSARSIRAPHVVVKGTQVAAATSQLTPLGFLTTARAGAITMSPYRPYSSNMKAGMTLTESLTLLGTC